MIPVCLGSFKASSRKKISAKLEYLIGIEMVALFATNTAIYALQEG